MNTYLIGDVHGQIGMLEALLTKIPAVAGDRILFLGDLVDRGPSPKAVVERVIDLTKEGRFEVVALRGNHEQMLLDCHEGRLDLSLFVKNGGRQTLRDYRKRGALYVPRAHRNFLERSPLYFEGEDFIAVHAGLRPGVPLAEQRAEDLLWIREPFLATDHDFGKLIVHGHTPTGNAEPEVRPNRIGLDTGAGFAGGRLTCLRLPDRAFYSVSG